jgi:fatty acid synthase subunit alpha, fungi type
MQTDGVKAVSVTSFGFGQVGGQVIVVHPDYLLATLEEPELETYLAKLQAREKYAYRYLHKGMTDNNLVQIKHAAPYTAEEEARVYLNPLARLDAKNKYTFPDASSTHTKRTEAIVEALTNSIGGQDVGVDVETISSINIANEDFLKRNFTDAEIEYCRKAPSPQASFAGTWSAKEAVFKSLGVKSAGGGAPLKEIEIIRDENGKPQVQFHGQAAEKAASRGVKKVKVAISHDDFQVHTSLNLKTNIPECCSCSCRQITEWLM